jgi:bifunctional non-homologous end joining protein LigD
LTLDAKMPPPADALDEYRKKREAGRTPEPFGGSGIARPRLFVVQKHAARRLHYDFRLEWGGVLKSWAVPRGPALDPAEKRLAVAVEDHPVEYADFEGVIPDGNYGAGAVIVWDQGGWIALEDPEEGMKTGKLLFELRGHKLRGVWTLVRTKGRQSTGVEWLLIKKPDAFARTGAADGTLAQESIFSGLTLEQLRDGRTPADDVRAELERLSARRRRVEAEEVEVMLAETRADPFSEPGWLYEIKYDGFRALALRDGAETALFYRRGRNAAELYPELTNALSRLPVPRLLLDGEIVVLDDDGRPNFHKLQQRAQLQRRSEIARGAIDQPVTLFIFDLLAFEDFDLRPLPLLTRKALLRRLLPRLGPLRYADHVADQGEAFFQGIRHLSLEGMMAKRADAPYRAGRSPDWLKVRIERTGDFVVVGFTEPKGSRTGFGGLDLAYHDGKGLVYAGRVGSGLTQKLLAATRERLEGLRVRKPACGGPLPTERGHNWVEPQLICEVRYQDYSDDGVLRFPVFLRFRDDKRIEECIKEAGRAEAEPPVLSAAGPGSGGEPEARKVTLSNLDKVFWPEEGYTKGDLLTYYRTVSRWLLPYLRERPVVLTRYPDGIAGKSFYQKDAPAFVPGWVRTERIWSELSQRYIDYFVCDDEETLLYVVNMGSIPLHAWASRVGLLGSPDWCILDLDPKEAPFADVIEVALALRALCQEIALPCYVKTSGQAGLHVLVPLGGLLTYDQSRQLAHLLSQVVVDEHPKIATLTRVIGARGGRVYLDWLQNRHGQTIVAPLSVRPVPGATVSTPLSWDEVQPGLDPRAFTIRSVPERLSSMAADPVLGVLRDRPDLMSALARLSERLGRRGE